MLKASAGHVNLSPDLEISGYIRTFQLQGNTLDTTDVLGNALPRSAITPGGSQNQIAVPPHDADGYAVQFGLTGIANGSGIEALPNPTVKINEIIAGKGVVQGQHRMTMRDWFKTLEGFSAHSLGR